MKILVIPTENPTEIHIPQDYPIPPVGSDFYINFHEYTPAESWDAVRSVLENDVLTVSEINSTKIYLQEGAPVGASGEGRDFRQEFLAYWEKHPSTRPPGF